MQSYPVILGKHEGSWLLLDGQEHVGAHAKARSGKTSTLAIPNALHYRGSLVILDIRGEIFRATAGHRAKRMGQDVYLLDPAGERSHRWNPLGSIDRRSPECWDQVSRIAYLLFPEAAATGGAGNTNADKFWEPAARAA